MKKLLFLVDDHSLDSNTLDFACFLAKLTHSKLTGVFHDPEKKVLSPESNGDNNLLNHLVHFTDACIKRESGYAIHKQSGLSVHELLLESRYADALIIHEAQLDEEHADSNSFRITRKILKEAECPVIIAPPKFHRIDEVIFTFDGKPSSVHAIKQFIYLFPEFRTRNIVVVMVNSDLLPDNDEYRLLEEWLNDHFEYTEFVMLEGDAQTRLLDYTITRQHSFIVMGAYGRTYFSELLRPSTAGPVLKLVADPVFIAHH